MLSDDDLDLADLDDEELAQAWDLWFDLAQSTNDDDPPHTHGVFQRVFVPLQAQTVLQRDVGVGRLQAPGLTSAARPSASSGHRSSRTCSARTRSRIRWCFTTSGSRTPSDPPRLAQPASSSSRDSAFFIAGVLPGRRPRRRKRLRRTRSAAPASTRRRRIARAAAPFPAWSIATMGS